LDRQYFSLFDRLLRPVRKNNSLVRFDLEKWIIFYAFYTEQHNENWNIGARKASLDQDHGRSLAPSYALRGSALNNDLL
jgi:hypothetical protein